jgi:hypothetical protein
VGGGHNDDAGHGTGDAEGDDILSGKANLTCTAHKSLDDL